MLKTEKELNEEGWVQLSLSLFVKEHKPTYFLFYNRITNCINEHQHDARFEKNINYLTKNWFKQTRKEFFKQNGEDKGKLMLLAKIGEMYTTPFTYYTTLVAPHKKCYERYMISTEEGYRKGMKVVALTETEEIIGKHFDNVVNNLIRKQIIQRRY